MIAFIAIETIALVLDAHGNQLVGTGGHTQRKVASLDFDRVAVADLATREVVDRLGRAEIDLQAVDHETRRRQSIDDTVDFKLVIGKVRRRLALYACGIDGAADPNAAVNLDREEVRQSGQVGVTDFAAIVVNQRVEGRIDRLPHHDGRIETDERGGRPLDEFVQFDRLGDRIGIVFFDGPLDDHGFTDLELGLRRRIVVARPGRIVGVVSHAVDPDAAEIGNRAGGHTGANNAAGRGRRCRRRRRNVVAATAAAAASGSGQYSNYQYCAESSQLNYHCTSPCRSLSS